MATIKISYVLAILNAERTLNQCLNGILLQDYPRKNYEVIIVDGGSTDNTLNIIKKFKKRILNLKFIKNSNKLSEGKGMGKDIGINQARGEFIVLLDHDNIINDKKWLKKMLYPFKDKKIMATQSLLEYREDDPVFLKYINASGVEDSFAIPYSLVSQVTLHPERFELKEKNYYLHTLNPKKVLFIGANGCIFRKEVFNLIGGYTRDVNVSASMAESNMAVAVVKHASLHHKTGSNFWKYFKKKIIYFNRFISFGYKEENFKWIPEGFLGKLRFSLMVLSNITLINPTIWAIKKIIKTKKMFWLMHPIYLFLMTLAYGIVTITKIKNYLLYIKR